MTPRRFFVSCLHCLRPVMLVDRIRDDELTQLRQHLTDRHPDAMKPPPLGIEALLRHFRVEAEPGPPGAA